jgi:hypothetical protein
MILKQQPSGTNIWVGIILAQPTFLATAGVGLDAADSMGMMLQESVSEPPLVSRCAARVAHVRLSVNCLRNDMPVCVPTRGPYSDQKVANRTTVGISVGDEVTRPFHDARRFPSTRL